MKLKGRYVARVIIDLETEDKDEEFTKAVKDYWMQIHDNISGKMPKHKFLRAEVTQQFFDMFEVEK